MFYTIRHYSIIQDISNFANKSSNVVKGCIRFNKKFACSRQQAISVMVSLLFLATL